MKADVIAFVALVALTVGVSASENSDIQDGRQLLASPSFAFKHGVASGDPDSSSIILWTRITPTSGFFKSLNVKWVVSESADLSRPVASGVFTTGAGRDYTVKLLASKLSPQTRYYYGFSKGSVKSPVGRFKLPAAPGTPQAALKYAIVSCSNWGFGYFNVYDAMSKIKDLDLWLHVGDYIYEYGIKEFPSETETVRPAATLDPQGWLYTLQDYRKRYALYHTDPALQALRAAAPLVAAWDDHEFANNAWKGGSEEHNVTLNGPWQPRVDAAVRAYHEWIPTRYLLDDSKYVKIWRSFQFGDLATLMMLETRITARTDSNIIPSVFNTVGGMGFAPYPPSAWIPSMIQGIQALKAQYDTYRNQPNLTVVGQEQLTWLAKTVAHSSDSGTTWQLLGQDTVMLEQFLPDFDKAIAAEGDKAKAAFWRQALTNLTDGANHTASFDTTTGYLQKLNGIPIPVSDAMRYAARVVLALGKYRVNWNFDSWAGYQVNKKAVLAALLPATNAIIYGGDSHNAWGGIESLEGRPVAAEFDGPAVTSIGLEGYFGFIPPELMAAGITANNAEFGMKYAEMNHKGFMLVDLSHRTHHTEYVYVDNVATTKYKTFCGYAVDTVAGKVGEWRQSATCKGA